MYFLSISIVLYCIYIYIPHYPRVWLKEKAGRFRLISCKHILLEVDHAIWDVEILAEAPLIAGAQDGRNSGFEMVVDVCDCKVWKWFKVREIAMC